jgi:biotin synthase
MEALNKIAKGNHDLSGDEIVELLNINNFSHEYFELLAVSNALSRRKFGNRGYVFTQIGINAEPCSRNCKFCSMGSSHYSVDSQWDKTAEEINETLSLLQMGYFDDFFLMTTADYPQDRFVSIGEAVKPNLRKDQKLVANIGDFDLQTALKLKGAGFTGAYHINRLREGEDTEADPIAREATIQAIKEAGLELYYCIEPIGPEHTYEELATEIIRAKNLKVDMMAAMRRVAVPGTPLHRFGQISAVELTKIVAVANIAVNPSRAMNVHEPIPVALLAGVNQLYAEVGANPRDTDSHTEQNRGFDPAAAWQMLEEFDYFPPQESNTPGLAQ